MTDVRAKNTTTPSRFILQTFFHLIIFAIALAPFVFSLPIPDSAIAVTGMNFKEAENKTTVRRQLPDNWRHNESAGAMIGRYETVVMLDHAPETLWGVFVPAHRSNLSVIINGVHVGDGGPFEPILARNYMQPLLLSIPTGLLKQGSNRIQIDLHANPAGHGFLDKIYLGPNEELRPSFRLHVLFLNTLVQIIVFAMFILAIIMMILWLFERSVASHGMLAGMAFTWALHTQNHVTSIIPVSLEIWDKVMLLSAVWTAIFGYFFINWYYLNRTAKLTGLERKTYDRPILIFSICLSILLAVLPMPLFYDAAITVAVPLQVLLLIYMLVQMVNVARHSNFWADHLLTGIAFLGVVYPAHDALITTGVIQDHVYYISAYFGLVAFLFFGSTLLHRFIENARSLESANIDLSQKIKERETELYGAFERQKTLERQSAREKERRAIMRDIHDGLGGHLVSILSVVEAQKTSDEDIASALRGALDELRLTINSLDTHNDSLTAVLALFRERLLSRYEQAGLLVEWDIKPTNDPPNFSPRVAQHILRILQEALTNAMKHANANKVRVSLQPASGKFHARLEFSDNGTGFDTNANSAGFGLKNMKSRAEEKGLRLDIQSSPGNGTNITLLI